MMECEHASAKKLITYSEVVSVSYKEESRD